MIENALGRTVICDTLDNAVRMARACANRVRIVTLDGQVMNAGGSMTGGSAAKSAGVLTRANTLAKLAAGIADGPVTLAAKAHLRNERPVIVAVSTNDALAGNAANLGTLLNRRGYFFVPFGQDSAFKKPRSLVADFTRLPQTVESALRGEQVQPMLYGTPVG